MRIKHCLIIYICFFILSGKAPAQRLIISNYDTYNYYNFGLATITNYNVVSFHNNNPTNKAFSITITGLSANTSYNIAIRTYVFNNNVIFNQNNRSTAGGAIQILNINSSTLINTGVFQIELRDSLNNVITNFPNQFLVLEKTQQLAIAGAPFDFLIYYAEDFFSWRGGAAVIPAFLQNTKDALTSTWTKEVTDWHLCDGLQNNMPLNTDSSYDVYIHCATDIRPAIFAFHQGNTLRSEPTDGVRAIFIDSRLQDFFSNPASVNERELLHEVISHEFLHGIQWSFVSLNSLKAKFGANYLTEISKRNWLTEGQAKFLETVFMKNYSTLSTNAAYSTTPIFGSYQYFTKELLDSVLGQKYKYFSLNEISYNYALFWRHLYEHNFSANTTDANRMALLRETAKLDTSSNLASINTFMSTALAAAGGTFTDFASGLKNFAERAYFHDTAYHNWDDPNKNNFYTAISSYTEAPETFNGTLFDKQYQIAKSYAFRPHKITFAQKGAVNVRFTAVAVNGAMANFHAKVFVADNKKIYDSREITVTNGVGNTEICVDTTSKKLIVLVTRIDANEGQFPDYKITVTPLNLAFTGAVTNGGLPLNVQFTNTSTSNILGYQWDFGDGTQSQEKSNMHSYITSGAFDVKLNYKDCGAGLALVKKAYVNLLPFICSVEIRKTNETTNACNFYRALKADVFSFAQTGNTFLNANDLQVKITASGKLKNLRLTLTDANNTLKFESNNIQPLSGNNREWEFLVPASAICEGINLINLSGSDAANNKLMQKNEPPAYPNLIAEGTNRWTSDTTGLTGFDRNYFFYVKPSQQLAEEIQVYTEELCGSSMLPVARKAIFVNNSNTTYSINFGDEYSNPDFKPYSVIVHYYSIYKSGFDIVLKKLDSLNQEITTTRTISF